MEATQLEPPNEVDPGSESDTSSEVYCISAKQGLQDPQEAVKVSSRSRPTPSGVATVGTRQGGGCLVEVHRFLLYASCHAICLRGMDFFSSAGQIADISMTRRHDKTAEMTRDRAGRKPKGIRCTCVCSAGVRERSVLPLLQELPLLPPLLPTSVTTVATVWLLFSSCWGCTGLLFCFTHPVGGPIGRQAFLWVNTRACFQGVHALCARTHSVFVICEFQKVIEHNSSTVPLNSHWDALHFCDGTPISSSRSSRQLFNTMFNAVCQPVVHHSDHHDRYAHVLHPDVGDHSGSLARTALSTS